MTNRAIGLLKSSHSSAWWQVLVSDPKAAVGAIIPGVPTRNAFTVTHRTMKQISKGMGLGTGKL